MTNRLYALAFAASLWLCLPAPLQGQAPRVFSNHSEQVAGQRFAMVAIPGGRFTMGSSKGKPDEQPPHEVEVDSFFMMATEVSMSQYMIYLQSINTFGDDSLRAKGGAYRVEASQKKIEMPRVGVSWEEAAAYARWLSAQTGRRFRLPTEAEWEYAARGGQNFVYAGGPYMSALGWYNGNSNGRAHPVAQKAPNGYGLYDMSGNLAEWCADWYDDDYYAHSPERNPQGPSSGVRRVLRGGTWFNYDDACRVSYRDSNLPDYRTGSVGFRLVAEYERPTLER